MFDEGFSQMIASFHGPSFCLGQNTDSVLKKRTCTVSVHARKSLKKHNNKTEKKDSFFGLVVVLFFRNKGLNFTFFRAKI